MTADNHKQKIPSAPKAVGIIMDGNRRWAKNRGLPKLQGHRVGLLETLRNTVRFVRDSGIRHLVVFMFSTENWSREPLEVSYLMDLFRESVQKEMKELGKEGVRIRFVGQRERFSKDLQNAIDVAEKETRHNDAITLWCCLSYGGRAEIVAAARSAAASGEEITEDCLARHLWTAEMPYPDIIIRTGGEMRTSNFLMWQSAYSEWFFIKKFWPDFTKEDFLEILEDFSKRGRRNGK